jgi:hypothetical protein
MTGGRALSETVVIPAKAVIQYAAAKRFYHCRLWDTGSSACADDDSGALCDSSPHRSRNERINWSLNGFIR